MTMPITIRRETEQDYFAAENCCRNAFWNVYTQGCYEHFLVHSLRSHKDFIPELSFVAEYNNTVIGGIYFSKSWVVPQSASLAPIPTITFGPVFIEPKFQGKGFGNTLITYALEKAREQGQTAIIILGYPAHYKHYGFCGGKKYNISMPDGKFYKSLLVLPLQEKILDNGTGYAKFSDVFEIDSQEAEIFDKQFPYKEKKILPSQKEFEKACIVLDD